MFACRGRLGRYRGGELMRHMPVRLGRRCGAVSRHGDGADGSRRDHGVPPGCGWPTGTGSRRAGGAHPAVRRSGIDDLYVSDNTTQIAIRNMVSLVPDGCQDDPHRPSPPNLGRRRKPARLSEETHGRRAGGTGGSAGEPGHFGGGHQALVPPRHSDGRPVNLHRTTTERSTSPRRIRANADSTSSKAIFSLTKADRSKRPRR